MQELGFLLHSHLNRLLAIIGDDYSQHMPDSYYKLNQLFTPIASQHGSQDLLCIYGSFKHYSSNIIPIGFEDSELSVVMDDFVSYIYEQGDKCWNLTPL